MIRDRLSSMNSYLNNLFKQNTDSFFSKDYFILKIH